MNLAQKIVVGIAIPLVVFALALGVIFTLLGNLVIHAPTQPMMGWGYCGTGRLAMYGLGFIGYILAAAFAIVAVLEFLLFRSKTAS